MSDYIVKKIKNILPESLIEVVNKEGGFYVAGGCITSIATNKEVNDIDMYFPSRKALVAAIRWMQEDTAWCCFISDKSITYTRGCQSYQFIYYDFYEYANDIWKHFDFTINMATYSTLGNCIVQQKDFLLHNSQRHLSFNPDTKFPILSALRIQKYEQRGYKIPRNEFVKIMLAINKLEINNWDDFKTQCGNLYGLNYIRDVDLKNKEFSIEAGLDIIQNTSFETGNSLDEYKVDPRIVDVIVSGETLEYVKFKDKIHVTLDHDWVDIIEDQMLDNLTNMKEISLKEYCGEYLYKWVDEDLRSHYDSSFQYELGKEAVAQGLTRWINREPCLYMLTKDNILTGGCYKDKGIILKCEYEEKNIVSLDDSDILISKVIPVAVMTKEDFS